MDIMPELESLFAEALELDDPAVQQDFLDSACSTDAKLRNRVGALIEANRRAAGFMSEPAGIVNLEEFDRSIQTFEPIEEQLGEQPGDRIGRYELLEQVGEGGMGTVFRAQQLQPVQQEVAIKVIKPGLDTQEVIARFASERQALARMNHPHIARAIDAGATASGRPFFAMEFVEGQSLDEYCSRKQLTTQERLRLFIPVCNAIQHAHQKGVIHRDIKPRNILVCERDGHAVAKVIDFGIAKATSHRLSPSPAETRIGQFIGTPAYMSPEQADPSSVDIDTRTDVYSLGATLYELLTGVTPFEQLNQKTNDEIRRVICEETPLQPSAAVSTHRNAGVTEFATQCRQTPDRLRTTIRGDLDWIVMQSLEKHPDRRYPTAIALANDLQRYLANQTVEARPPTTAYRMQKFVSRNRLAVVCAGIVTLSLVLATVISAQFGIWALESKREAQEQTKRAHWEQVGLQSVVEFMNQGILAQASPFEQADPNLTVRQALDRAAQRLARPQDQPLRPDVSAAIRITLGKTYRGLGEYQQSEMHLRRAHQITENEWGSQHQQTAQVGNELVSTLLAQSNFDEASKFLDQSEKAASESGDTELNLKTKHLRASLLHANQRTDLATPLFREVFDSRKAMLGPLHPETHIAATHLAFAYQTQGRISEALPMLEQAYNALRNESHWHPLANRIAIRLATLHANNGDLALAEQLYKDILNELRVLMGEQSPDTISAKHRLAQVYSAQRRLLDAAPLLDETLLAQTRQLGPDHSDTLETKRQLAGVLARLNRHAKAQILLEEVLATHRQLFGDNHPQTRDSTSALAFFHLEQSQFPQAASYYEILSTSLNHSSHDSDTRAIIAQMMLGLCRHKSGNYQAAKVDLRSALDRCLTTYPDTWLRPLIEGQLGEVHMRLGEREAAEDALRNSYDLLQQQESELPLRWKPMGLRAVTRRLAEFYEAADAPELKAKSLSYRKEYENICQNGFTETSVKAGSKKDGTSN